VLSVSLPVPQAPAELLSDLLDQAVAPLAPTELLADLPDQAVDVEEPGQEVLEGEVQEGKQEVQLPCLARPRAILLRKSRPLRNLPSRQS
jgi:hypothetical protein